MCFTCKLGKTHWSFVKETGEVKIVQKKVKKLKGKQDKKMANVSEGGKEELAVDMEMTKVGQSKETGKQDLDMEWGTKVDIEMAKAKVTLRSEPEVGKGKGWVTPAIILEPPTLVKSLTDLADVGPSKLKGKHQKSS